MVLHVGLISTSTAGTWWRFWQCAGCCTACAATPPLAWLHGYSRVPYPARPAKTEHQPAETSDRFTQIKPQPGLLKFHGSTTGGPCVDDDAASTSATTGRRAARRLRVGLEAGPGTAARLEAGSCGEGFASLFQGRPYSRIRSALAVPCFSAAGCPRRVCRNPHSVCGLFWILLPVLTCTV